MENVDALRQKLPEEAKDLKINLQSVLKGGSLSTEQCWGVALACAYACRNPELRQAIEADAVAQTNADVVSDAKAAASLMGMNNIFYRFRHFMGSKGNYGKLPARLRMQRMAKPATNMVDFELFSLGVSAINGCELCITSHEKAVLDGGLSEQHVHDTVRIAAVLHGVATALELG